MNVYTGIEPAVTAAERRAVEAAAEAVIAFADWSRTRVQAERAGGLRRSDRFPGQTGNEIIEAVAGNGVRWAVLADAALVLSSESGLIVSNHRRYVKAVV
jgi:hypothetical protein